MSLKVFIDDVEVEVTTTRFPAGESCIKVEPVWLFIGQSFEILFHFENNGELFDLCLLVDALRRHHPGYEIFLNMPYLPYARQDRVCNRGESLSVKVVADLINSLNFEYVLCTDIHSSVGEALINRLISTPLAVAGGNLKQLCKPIYTSLVSPDAGAEKKVFDFAKKHGYSDVVRASKVRNVSTGKIEYTSVIDPIENHTKDFLIVDDICDGGRTFIELAKVIRERIGNNEQKILLYVTHGIFSAGLEELEKHFNHIYVANLMNKKYVGDKLITVI